MMIIKSIIIFLIIMEKNEKSESEKLNDLIEEYNIVKSKRNFYINRKDIIKE